MELLSPTVAVHHSSRWARLRSGILHLVLLALPALALAQAPADGDKASATASTSAASGTSGTTSAAPAPAPIAVPEIAARADDDERLAVRIDQRAAALDPSVALGAKLSEIESSVEAMLNAYSPQQLERLPVMRLESLQRLWKFDQRRFKSWRDELQLTTQPYLDDAAALASRRAAWEVTREKLRVQDLPPALAQRLDAMVKRLMQTELQLAAPLAAQLELRRRASAVELHIQQGQGGVEQAIRSLDKRLLRIDSPPLWAARSGGDGSAAVRESLEIETRFAREYRQGDNDRPVVLHAFQIVLLPLLLWMSLRSRRASVEGGVATDSVRALARPISLWLLLAMIAVLVIEPDAPLLVQQVAMVLALVPMLRLLPQDAAKRLAYWPYIISVLFVVARMSILVLGNDLMYRVYLLVVGLLALFATLWMLRLSRRPSDGTGPAWQPGRGLNMVAWTAVGLLAIATVSNLVGNFSLAEMLVLGITDSAYLALMLYAGVSVSSALLHWSLERPVASRFVRAPQRASALATLATRLIKLVAICGWAVYTMNQFRIFRPIYDMLTRVLGAHVEIGEISISLGNVLAFVVGVLIAFWVARGVRALVHDEVLGRLSVSRGVGNSVASLTYYAVLLVGLLLALSAAGFKVSQLTIVFGALGVGIGFGLQNVVNNFVSGLVLMFERPIQPGDTIEVGTVSGTVTDIGLRATTVRTFDGADVVVPNGTLLSANLVNWTLRDRSRRIELEVGVGRESDPAQVTALLIATAGQTPGTVSQPAPSAFFTGFVQGALQFSVRVWTFDFDNWYAIRSDLATRVHQAFSQAGIEVAFPQRDLHVRSVSEEVGAQLAKPPQPQAAQ